MIDRDFRYQGKPLTIMDGLKGLRKAIEETFGKLAIIQRCQWHKRENIENYLREEGKEKDKGQLDKTYIEPEYVTAKRKLFVIIDELRKKIEQYLTHLKKD